MVVRAAGAQAVLIEVAWAPPLPRGGVAARGSAMHSPPAGVRIEGSVDASRRAWLDRDLVLRARGGEEVAFALLAKEIGDRLHATAYHILRDHDLAADAVQVGLIDMWRKLPQLREPDAFMAWAYRIVVRAAHAEIARRARWRVAGVAIEIEPSAEHAEMRDVEDRDLLEHGFSRIGVDHRTVLVLKHYASLSNAEIATVLGVPEGTVRSRLFHAMQALRAALDAAQRSTAGSNP